MFSRFRVGGLCAVLAVLFLPSAAKSQALLVPQNDTTHPITFTLIRATYPSTASSPGSPDHIAGLTGALTGGTITAQISKAGGSFASATGTLAEVGIGVYSYTPASGDMATLGAWDLYAQASLSNATTAPTTATATTGGTFAAGTYTCAYSWTTGTGETQYSTTATQVTTGSASTITLTAPSIPANASGVNWYVSTTNGNASTMTRASTTWTNSVTIVNPPSSQPAAPSSNTATTSDPVNIRAQVVAFNPYDSGRLGLGNIPSTAPGTSGGALTYGVGTGQLNPSGGILPGVTTALTGTATAGSSTSITLAAGPATTDMIKGNYVLIASGTGAGQARTITAWNGSTLVATVSRAWAVNPASDSVYYVIMNPHPALDSNLAVTASSVTGNVGGDVAGKVLGGGSSSITGDGVRAASVTGNVGGNVTGSVGSVTGNVGVGSYATGMSPREQVLLANLDTGLPLWLAIYKSYCVDAGNIGTINYVTSGSNTTQTTPYQRSGDSTTAWSSVITTNSSGKATTRTHNDSTLPTGP